MKLTKLDVISIVAVLFLGQNHYYTGSGVALCGMALVLIFWSALTD